MATHPFNLKLFSSSSPSLIKPLTRCLYHPLKKYSEGRKRNRRPGEVEEKAPSTADTLKSIAEEKLHGAEQGVASQNFEKTYEGVEEAVVGESKGTESVKKRFKENEDNASYRKSD